ncbi:hypothetical protein ACG7TL_005461 [Trametes sanguinea]
MAEAIPAKKAANLLRATTRAEFLTALGRLDITALPPKGELPTVEKGSPDDRFRHIPQRAMDLWKCALEGSTCMIVVYGQTRTDTKTTTELTNKLVRIFQKITEEAPPGFMPPGPPPQGVPWRDVTLTWLVEDLSPRASRLLVKQGLWSTLELTFFAYDLDLSIPTFLLALEGFTQIRPTFVASIVKDVLNQNPALAGIEALTVSNPKFAGRSPKEGAEEVVESVHVTMCRINEDDEASLLVAYVYMNSPTHDPSLWGPWRDSLYNVDFTGRSTRPVTTRRPTRCVGCKGVDHMTHQCPFPAIPGWHGGVAVEPQQAQQQQQTRDLSHFAPAGRGGRGGLGRGGYQQEAREYDGRGAAGHANHIGRGAAMTRGGGLRKSA